MLSVFILEDDNYTQRFLEKLISGHPQVAKVLVASTAKKAIQVAEEFNIDVAVLDIELSQYDSCNGIEVAKNLKAMQPNIMLIFVTGYTHYALESFSVHPYDYIVKPINKAKLTDILTEIASIKDTPPDKELIPKKNISLKIDNQIFYVNFDDIFFIEKIGKKALIHTKNGYYPAIINCQILSRYYRNILKEHINHI